LQIPGRGRQYSKNFYFIDTRSFKSINFSEPSSFRAFAQQNNHSADKIQSYLTTQLLHQREATFGPSVTSQKTLIAQVLGTEIVVKAKGSCNEMLADCTQISIDLMLRLLSMYWRRFLTGINIYNIELQLEWSDESLKPILLPSISALIAEGVLIRCEDSLKRPGCSDRRYTLLNRLGMLYSRY
jgi:hypothetical protein